MHVYTRSRTDAHIGINTQGHTPPVQTEMHIPTYAHAHILTHVPLTPCNLEKTLGVHAPSLQIKDTIPTNSAKECHLVVASGPGLRQAAFSWGTVFPRATSQGG